MQRNKNKQTAAKGYRFYDEDIEYLDWLCSINDCTTAEMMHNLLQRYAQTNDQVCTNTQIRERASIKK